MTPFSGDADADKKTQRKRTAKRSTREAVESKKREGKNKRGPELEEGFTPATTNSSSGSRSGAVRCVQWDKSKQEKKSGAVPCAEKAVDKKQRECG